MIRKLVLLTGGVEGPHLAEIVGRLAPGLQVTTVETKHDLLETVLGLAAAEPDGIRLIGFCTNVIVPADVLAAAGCGAYNFHPGPPTYPGSHAASFAIYDRAKRFGVTAHRMAEKVDAGEIVAVDWFDMPEGARFTDLEVIAYQRLLRLFNSLALRLVTDPQPLPPVAESWSARKTTTREFERMKEVTAEMDEDEIRLRWRAFG